MRVFMCSLLRLPTAIAAIVFVSLCVMAQTAQAQSMGGRGRHQAQTSKTDDKAAKADDKAYKDALKRIPDKKVDPWETMR
jgi:hypothetical protein